MVTIFDSHAGNPVELRLENKTMQKLLKVPALIQSAKHLNVKSISCEPNGDNRSSVSIGAYPTISMIPSSNLGRKKPFNNYQLVLVPHLRMSAVKFVEASIKMGAHPGRVTVLYKNYLYPEGVEVLNQLRRLGIVVVPLEQKSAELARISAHIIMTGCKLVVYDDGAEIIPDILANEHLRAPTVGFVEQTTRGRNKLRQLYIPHPTLSLPDSEFKQTFECGSVGQAGAEALEWHVGGHLFGKRLTVIGCAGVIGTAFSREASARGLCVRGFDIAPKGRYFALNAFPFMTMCATKAEALHEAELVVGATGSSSLASADLPLLKDGVVLASMSSGQIEFPLDDIRRLANGLRPFQVTSDRQPHGDTYWMKWGRTITVLDGGRPLNLGVAAGPEAACFDLVMAVILVGLAEVAAGCFDGKVGLQNCFDDLIQRHNLASLYMALHSDRRHN